jgi:transposase-like protein
LERGGNVQAKVVTDITSQTLLPNIMEDVEKGATICTDEWCSYNALTKAGYNHHRVAHGIWEYIRNGVHTNSIEGFWSPLKQSINGNFHHVSKQHLQKYVNEFVYRYNLRRAENPIFQDLPGRVADLHA